MITLYSHLYDTFTDFKSKKEFYEYIEYTYQDDLTHLEIVHEYQNIYCLYDTDSEEYL